MQREKRTATSFLHKSGRRKHVWPTVSGRLGARRRWQRTETITQKDNWLLQASSLSVSSLVVEALQQCRLNCYRTLERVIDQVKRSAVLSATKIVIGVSRMHPLPTADRWCKYCFPAPGTTEYSPGTTGCALGTLIEQYRIFYISSPSSVPCQESKSKIFI